MILATTEAGRQRARAEQARIAFVIETRWARGLARTIRGQWLGAATAVAGGRDIAPAVAAPRAAMVTDFRRNYVRVAGEFGRRAMEELQAIQARGTIEDAFWQSLSSWSRLRAARMVRNVNDSTKRRIARIVAAGVADNQAAGEIARRIREGAAIHPRSNAATIAGTEVGAAASYSMDQAVRKTGLKLTKVWVALLDSRTRAEHRKANGQRRTMDAPFTVGGAQLKFPRDPAGPADMVIGCRCGVIWEPARKPR